MDPRQALAVMGALGEGVLPRRKQPTTYVTLERKPKVVRDKSNRVRDPKHKGRRR